MRFVQDPLDHDALIVNGNWNTFEPGSVECLACPIICWIFDEDAICGIKRILAQSAIACCELTFLASAVNISLLGIGGAFWGLVIGLVAYIVLNGRLPRRDCAELAASKAAAE